MPQRAYSPKRPYGGTLGNQSFIGKLLNVKVDNGLELIVKCRPDQALPGARTAVQMIWGRDRAIVVES